jgi:hypothetical protein
MAPNSVRLWRYRYYQQHLDDEYKPEPPKQGDVAFAGTATPGIWLPEEGLEERIRVIILEFNSSRSPLSSSEYIAAKLKERAK